MRKVFLALVAAVSIAALTLPAERSDAATLDAHFTPTGDPARVACPGNLTVTAEATGTPGLSFSYDISSNFNGQTAWVVQPKITTMPASGSATATVVVPIPKLTGSGSDLKLDVSANNIPAKSIQIPIACTIAGGDLSTPGGLARSRTDAACRAHFSDASLASSCESAEATKFVLQWDYDQDGCVNKPCASPDGFNILRSRHGSAYAVTDAQNREPGQTAIVFSESLTDVYGSCFEVQARKDGSDLGTPSSAFCSVPDPATIEASQLTTTNDFFHQSENATAFTGCPASGGNPLGQSILTHNTGELDVGFINQDNSCSMTDSLRQGVVEFDLSQILPFKIRTASFEMHVAAAAENVGTFDAHSNGSEFSSRRSCAVSVGTPSNWRRGDALPTHINFSEIATLPTPDGDGWIRADVTDVVRKWVSSSGSNNGLIVAPQPQSIDNGSNSVWALAKYRNDSECLTAYSGVGLRIVYEL